VPKPWIVNEWIPTRQKILAVVSKVMALLGLTALALLLTRPAASLPVGWIVFVVAVIQITLSYSPKPDSAYIGRRLVRRCTGIPSIEQTVHMTAED